MKFIFEMPVEMLQKTDKKGTVERFLYNTRTYEASNAFYHTSVRARENEGYELDIAL